MSGKRDSKEAVIFSLPEKKTETYPAYRIRGKTSDAVIQTKLGDRFSKVFKAITVDSGSEFSDFAKVEQWGHKSILCPPVHLMGAAAE